MRDLAAVGDEVADAGAVDGRPPLALPVVEVAVEVEVDADAAVAQEAQDRRDLSTALARVLDAAEEEDAQRAVVRPVRLRRVGEAHGIGNEEDLVAAALRELAQEAVADALGDADEGGDAVGVGAAELERGRVDRVDGGDDAEARLEERHGAEPVAGAEVDQHVVAPGDLVDLRGEGADVRGVDAVAGAVREDGLRLRDVFGEVDLVPGVDRPDVEALGLQGLEEGQRGGAHAVALQFVQCEYDFHRAVLYHIFRPRFACGRAVVRSRPQ